MTHNPNVPPYSEPDSQYPQAPQAGQYLAGSGQHGQHQQQSSNHPYPPPHPMGPHPQPFGRDGLPPLLAVPFQVRKRPFGPSFWIVAGILAILVLGNAVAGQGEAILIFLGIAAALTGLIAMAAERRTWANLPSRKAAMAVCLAGVASLLIGGVAAGASASNDGGVRAAAQPLSTSELESDAAAKLKAREDAVAAKESAAGPVEPRAAATTISQGVWTVGTDIEPGDYKTTKAVVGDCSWKITRTGSNGSDYIDYDFNVSGGFPMVSLVEGHTFDTDGCGDWVKQ